MRSVYTLRSCASSTFRGLSQDQSATSCEVCKTDHNNAISAQQRVDQSFAEEHAVCQVQYFGTLFVADILESNCVSDL